MNAYENEKLCLKKYFQSQNITRYFFTENDRFAGFDAGFVSGGTYFLCEAKFRKFPSYQYEEFFLEEHKYNSLMALASSGFTALYINTFTDGVVYIWDIGEIYSNYKDMPGIITRILPSETSTIENEYGSGKKKEKGTLMLSKYQRKYSYQL